MPIPKIKELGSAARVYTIKLIKTEGEETKFSFTSFEFKTCGHRRGIDVMFEYGLRLKPNMVSR